MVTDPDTKTDIRKAAEEEERLLYNERAPNEWLEALAPLGTDENKPFLEIAPYLIVIFPSPTVWTQMITKSRIIMFQNQWVLLQEY